MNTKSAISVRHSSVSHSFRSFLLTVLCLAIVLVFFRPLGAAAAAQAAAPSLDHTVLTIPVGGTAIIRLKNAPSGKTTNWKTTFSKVLKVQKINDQTAKVTGIIQGTARCQAIVAGKTLTCRVHVRNNPSLSLKEKRAVEGSSFELTVSGTLSSPKWSTSRSGVASLTRINARKYRINCKQAGTAVIMARVNGKKLRCSVTVVKAKKTAASTKPAASAAPTAKASLKPAASAAQNAKAPAENTSSASAKGNSSAARKYVITSNYNYTSGVSILGEYPSIDAAVSAIHAQKPAKQGQWFVVVKGTRQVVWPDLTTNAQKVQKALDWAYGVASDPKHGYSCEGELTNTGCDTKWGRWGRKGDYSCSTLVIMAYELAGIANLRSICQEKHYTIPVGRGRRVVSLSSKNIHQAIAASGQFTNVTSQYKSAPSKKGFLIPGDILIMAGRRHVGLYYGNGRILEATMNEKRREYATPRPGDQTSREIWLSPWQLGWCEVWRPKQ